MGKGMVPDRVALVINALGNAGEFVGLNADQKESRSRVFALQHVENLRSPLRIGAIVKRQSNLVRTISITAEPIRLRQSLKDLVGDQLRVRIDRQITSAVRGLVFNAK